MVPPDSTDPDRVAAEVDEYVRSRSGLSSLKRPKRIVVVDRIPKSAVGKVLRRELVQGNFVPLADRSSDGNSQGTEPRTTP